MAQRVACTPAARALLKQMEPGAPGGVGAVLGRDGSFGRGLGGGGKGWRGGKEGKGWRGGGKRGRGEGGREGEVGRGGNKICLCAEYGIYAYVWGVCLSKVQQTWANQ